MSGCCSACGADAVTQPAPCGAGAMTASSAHCGACGSAVDPLTGAIVPTPGVCAPGPGNVPVTDAEYQNSLGVCLQDAVDSARRIQHELGMRPYRVRLVWWDRDRHQRFTDDSVIRELELTPVQVGTFNDVSWELTQTGMDDDGQIILTEISPAQVDSNDLMGKGDPLAEDPPPGMEFFYEIQQIARCAGAHQIQPGRYTPASLPYFDGEDFQWAIVLTAQSHPRSATPDRDTPDRDNTFKPGRLRRKYRNTLRT